MSDGAVGGGNAVATATFVRYDDTVAEPPLIPPGETYEFGEDTPWERAFFGSAKSLEPGPQGFLIENVPPGTTVPPHFHEVDQFQLFFGGDGSWYGATPIGPIFVHYVDAYSTYGPFGTGAQGRMEFYTLRATPTLETHYMPASREKLRGHVGRRNLHVNIDPAGGLGGCGERALSDDDGLAVDLIRLSPDEALAVDGSGGGSAYHCVVAGEIAIGDVVYGPRSLGYSEAGSDLRGVAGPQGASVLTMRFPRSA